MISFKPCNHVKLTFQGPRKLGYLVNLETSDMLLLRTLTLLATLCSAVKYDHLGPIDFPPEDSAASPDTM